jgi:hypothetical protein
MEAVRGQTHSPEADPIDQEVATKAEVVAHELSLGGAVFRLRTRGSLLPSGRMAEWQTS